jgi:integrase
MHPVIVPLVMRLKEKSSDGFLIPRLLNGGTDGKRGHYVGKRFSYIMRRLGFTDRALTFHTLRNSFMQRCDEAGIPESTVKLLVGHSRPSLTYGRYSPGREFEGLKKEVAKVTFGETDGVVRADGRGVEVRPSQGKRHRRRR